MPLKGFKPPNAHVVVNHIARASSNSVRSDAIDDKDGFRVLLLRAPERPKTNRRRSRMSSLMPRDYARSNNIDPDAVDWKSIWPGPSTFNPSAIPIPVKQGRLKAYANVKPFDKNANMELMKIPNFFHLTPPAIKAHCEALKKFCTPFPEQLQTKEECQKHFPLTVITNDYLHSAPTIRDPLARIVTIKLKLKDIPLDEHARDKLMRLVRDRYNDKTDELTITTDRCPTRKQNYDYAMYLITALFHESWTVEEWESQKSEADMEKYVWERNMSAKALASLLKWTPDKFGKGIFQESLPEEGFQPNHYEYGKAVKKLFEGESQDAVEQYKKATLEILSLQSKDKPLQV